jgi:hypothetical protein
LTVENITYESFDVVYAHIDEYRALPEGFNQWTLADESGWTIAHVAARMGLLPQTFNDWTLATSCDDTVAHEYLRSRRQWPKNFHRLDLVGNHGTTTAHIAAQLGLLPKGFAQWDLADNDGWTVAHVCAFWGNLPPRFKKWDLADNDGWTVAHERAMCKPLPKKFDQWDLADNDGQTVLDVALTSDWFYAENRKVTAPGYSVPSWALEEHTKTKPDLPSPCCP